jgi:phage portal protein BeeE
VKGGVVWMGSGSTTSVPSAIGKHAHTNAISQEVLEGVIDPSGIIVVPGQRF